MKLAERLKYINRIAGLIEEEAEEIAYLESLDTGLPISQTRKQALRSADNFRFYAQMVQTRLHGDAYQVDDQFINYTVYQPLGVVGLITPWNAPIMLETWKVAPALATGNTVVLKPAELSPLTANKLAEIILKAGLPEGVFNVVHGFGETAGAALTRHPDVKGISFTGEDDHRLHHHEKRGGYAEESVHGAGREVAAHRLRRRRPGTGAGCGGVGNFLLQRGALHVQRAGAGAQKHQRPVCGGPQRTGGQHPDWDPMDPETELGPLIERKHYEKVTGYIELAKQEGCEVYQGKVPEEFRKGNYVPPTLLLNARNDMRVCQEEIFGPVMAVIEFETEEEALAMANDVRYGLAGFVWTNNLKRAHRLAQAIEAGMIWINSQNVRDLRIPFGGMKDSGIGREGGYYSFEFYTEPKVIHVAIGDHHIPQFGKKKK